MPAAWALTGTGVLAPATQSKEEEHQEHPRALFWPLALSVTQSFPHALDFCLSAFLSPFWVSVCHVTAFNTYIIRRAMGHEEGGGALIPRAGM